MFSRFKMKYILKSGRGFVKREKDIIMYPACKGGEKVIHSPCIKELWEEMKYLDKNFSYNNIDIYLSYYKGGRYANKS